MGELYGINEFPRVPGRFVTVDWPEAEHKETCLILEWTPTDLAMVSTFGRSRIYRYVGTGSPDAVAIGFVTAVLDGETWVSLCTDFGPTNNFNWYGGRHYV